MAENPYFQALRPLLEFDWEDPGAHVPDQGPIEQALKELAASPDGWKEILSLLQSGVLDLHDPTYSVVNLLADHVPQTLEFAKLLLRALTEDPGRAGSSSIAGLLLGNGALPVLLRDEAARRECLAWVMRIPDTQLRGLTIERVAPHAMNDWEWFAELAGQLKTGDEILVCPLVEALAQGRRSGDLAEATLRLARQPEAAGRMTQLLQGIHYSQAALDLLRSDRRASEVAGAVGDWVQSQAAAIQGSFRVPDMAAAGVMHGLVVVAQLRGTDAGLAATRALLAVAPGSRATWAVLGAWQALDEDPPREIVDMALRACRDPGQHPGIRGSGIRLVARAACACDEWIPSLEALAQSEFDPQFRRELLRRLEDARQASGHRRKRGAQR